MNTIDINYEIDDFKNIINEDDIIDWTCKVLSQLKIDNKVLSLYFTTDEIILELNKNYRKRDYITNVLSFPPSKDFAFEDPDFLGDIAICVSQAKREADEKNNDLISEIKFLILHGILHLNGYDHEVDDGEMDKLEKEIYYKLTGEEIE